MSVAIRVTTLALVLLLCAGVLGQTRLPENNSRNISPTVGTGGTPGGATGLFTIYDGSTLKRGEFSFSVAYSNYDRDPGNADFTEVPISFQIGLNDYLELFFTTDAYQEIKPNKPQNLSGFYLPNSTALVSTIPAAIILTPTTISGSLSGLPAFTNAVFRPSFNFGGQPVVQFPYVGGPGPNFNHLAPPSNIILGPASGGGTGSRGAASNFPGIGSPFGSILPGIVLSQRTIPANLNSNAITVPDLFTIQPSYLPDAPFLNQLDSHTSFSTFNFGMKVRFTGPSNPLGVGFVAFYRWYADHANGPDGWDQLEKGASPGANFGDFGAIGFVSGRLSRSVNVSTNFGYILNTNPRSEEFGNQKVTLLDRPDELVAGIGFDFPINRHVQPMTEVKEIRYVGEFTPNALPNNPIDIIAGAKFYPLRNVGFGAAYRRHLNLQDSGHFNGTLPNGFVESEGGNGYMFQFFAGKRNPSGPATHQNHAPSASLTASTNKIALGCVPGVVYSEPCTNRTNATVQLATTAIDPDGDPLVYSYTVTAGHIVGKGANVSWDLYGVAPGTYTVVVHVDDGSGHQVSASTSVVVTE